MIPRDKFPNEDIQRAWMRTFNEERQAFHDAVAESQKRKNNSNLNISAACHIIADASDDFIDDDPPFTILSMRLTHLSSMNFLPVFLLLAMLPSVYLPPRTFLPNQSPLRSLLPVRNLRSRSSPRNLNYRTDI